ncbi:LPO_1073/Vpar_1526 family protein [Bacteroides caecigallinarum]|uniref:LPO_1073/Vpar_1526 family protein n=1 Tax=Bacteroides caecigallinarum TaxID=1411144 RepID=UPI001EF522A1|nr:LPO_1073/Vpar_1526 family protein [Bacteroides caecigallinarum]
MLDYRKLQVGNIENSSNVIIINGNLHIDRQVYGNIKEAFLEILQEDMKRYSVMAKVKVEEEVEKCLQSLIIKLVEEQRENLIEKFQDISIQSVLHDALLGYMISDEDVKEYIIDELIERLKIRNSTTNQFIINEAINLLPKLSSSALLLLAILQLRHQIANVPISFMLKLYFEQLTQMIDTVENITDMDIEYLVQCNCVYRITGLYHIETYEHHLLRAYDLFFRKPITSEVLKDFKEKYPKIMSPVNDFGTCMFCANGEDESYFHFCDINSKLFYKRLSERGQDFLIPMVEELKIQTPLYKDTEVREYFYNLNSKWENVFSLLNGKSLIWMDTSILGKYIGSKVLEKYIKNSTRLSINDFNNPMTL